jgi:beta-carotene/zeaxanthin 4-ketolase
MAELPRAIVIAMTSVATVVQMTPRRQGAIGLALALAVIAAWLAVHVWAVFFYPWQRLGVWPAMAVVAVQTWLCVGLFIVAHDCMHGSLVPLRPRWNRVIGTVCLALYACFDFQAVNPKHHLHHRHAGTDGDPDFDGRQPHRFWPWYVKFFGAYFTWGQLGLLAVVNWTYILVLGAPQQNVLLFWALPAILSSLQLFTFGTYLPHVPADPQFPDRHNARSNDFSAWLSLLTCFHFGYHHEHHLAPGVPWWRLPATRRARSS